MTASDRFCATKPVEGILAEFGDLHDDGTERGAIHLNLFAKSSGSKPDIERVSYSQK